MKQFKVNSKNTVYNVFADSEVEAVNKVKEVEAKVGDAWENDIRVEWQKVGIDKSGFLERRIEGKWMSRSFQTWGEAVAYAKKIKSNPENHSVGIQVNGYWFDWDGRPRNGKSLSQVLKKTDSIKVGDSKKLSDLSYELAQMANYFDRANSSHSRKWLAKDDEVMLRKFYDLGIQTLNQLKIDIDGMKKEGFESNLGWWGDNKTYDLLKDASSRMYFTDEPKLVALSKKFDPLIREYYKLSGGNK